MRILHFIPLLADKISHGTQNTVALYMFAFMVSGVFLLRCTCKRIISLQTQNEQPNPGRM